MDDRYDRQYVSTAWSTAVPKFRYTIRMYRFEDIDRSCTYPVGGVFAQEVDGGGTEGMLKTMLKTEF